MCWRSSPDRERPMVRLKRSTAGLNICAGLLWGSVTSPTTSPGVCSSPVASDRLYTLNYDEPYIRLAYPGIDEHAITADRGRLRARVETGGAASARGGRGPRYGRVRLDVDGKREEGDRYYIYGKCDPRYGKQEVRREATATSVSLSPS